VTDYILMITFVYRPVKSLDESGHAAIQKKARHLQLNARVQPANHKWEHLAV